MTVRSHHEMALGAVPRGLRLTSENREVTAAEWCLMDHVKSPVSTDSGQIMRDADQCYRAVQGRDRRFDGVFYTGVRTTGIYCRPSCPATTPQRKNVTF